MINKSAAPLMTGCLLAALSFAVAAQEVKPVKIGVVTFLSGAAAGPFGVPARNGAEVVVEALNAGGQVPAPYATKGIGGAPIEIVLIDEAGGTTKQVTEFRNLVQRENVDLVDRLHLQRRLPRDRAGGRGAEEADGLLRLRHAAHLRGRELQVRVPHRRHGDDGQRRRRAVRDRDEARHEEVRRHQPELRLGPGLVERLRGVR